MKCYCGPKPVEGITVLHDDLEQAFSLAGRVAVVTGAGSGIGSDIALVLSQAGAQVVVSDLAADGLVATARDIEAGGGTAVQHLADISEHEQVEGLADHTVRTLGKIDIWVNAAGVLINRPIEEVSKSDLDHVLGVNLHGVYWGCAAAGRAMKPRGRGAIINISSGGGETAVAGLSLYSMSKAGVNMLTRTVAKEFGPSGIRANAIAPGWIETPMVAFRFRNAAGEIDPQLREDIIAQRAQASPMGLTGKPRDIALAALYLASDASRFVTGQILRPNGGVAMP